MKPSRQVIPAEIVVSLFALSYAWFGGIPWPEPSPLYRMLFAREGLLGVLTWALLLGVPAAWLVFVAAREWFCWRRCGWNLLDHEHSAILRGRLVITQCVAWLYVLHLYALSERRVLLLAFHAAIGAGICAWSYLENRRVRREIRYATTAFAASR